MGFKNSNNLSKMNLPKILAFLAAVVFEIVRSFSPSEISHLGLIANFRPASSTASITTTSLYAIGAASLNKNELLSLVSSTPSGIPTPKSMTKHILRLVHDLELKCPTPDDQVLPSLQGSWELLWTAQDPRAPEAKRPFLGSWINPIENQSYSNNPTGRVNPFLPAPIQDRLEALGLVSATPVRSTQAIDLKKGVIRNIVALNLGRDNNKIYSLFSDPPESSAKNSSTYFRKEQNHGNRRVSIPTRASLTVSIGVKPVPSDPRRVNVKFDKVRVSVPGTPVDWEIPFGMAGPSGWLRTVYIDNDLRISRGHKGSVFVLCRPRRAEV